MASVRVTDSRRKVGMVNPRKRVSALVSLAHAAVIRERDRSHAIA